ncbi:hypothetical protein TetV_360 [Tetraselmis virus 1]|uniref:Uncharacterized protein n=1 Tax=Tetraselmis virus 1 TaxID=2060617 RepID=A0A2P0VNH2_9VIRU|nr:hypothetical protein QJ968_gp360 [Tetraselmis virus 1]AUF82452.1 hypothetical protein TetV_360 [Tetraselmis virus 1]
MDSITFENVQLVALTGSIVYGVWSTKFIWVDYIIYFAIIVSDTMLDILMQDETIKVAKRAYSTIFILLHFCVICSRLTKQQRKDVEYMSGMAKLNQALMHPLPESIKRKSLTAK